ncbi:MAG: ABC transporter ATP-binding protein [Acidimicrobiia bacterium]|nr:ABC transporter ATP-binding protein [Acidimicrobiia bacterium]MYC44617.1 ABC transporter ATP-binding protein [Acidimicrobiia bacterium]MYI18979.1 ABC transporter ATP-binding protein [Acidimicrobiia bacterium]
MRFGGHEPITALEDVSFDIDDGEFVAIVGPSGCGKSTLLRIIAGLLEPTAGSVTVRGKTPSEARRDVEFGFVFQSPVLFPWLRVLGNVLLPDRILGKRNPLAVADAERHARGLLRDVGLEGFEEYYPEQISGGMQQRVALARALSYGASTLLMDEPFGALDEFTRDNLNIQLLEVWQQTRSTVLFVTHSLQEAIFLSDRVVVLSPRPGSVMRIADVPFGRPRDLTIRYRPDFAALNGELRELLQIDAGAAGDGEVAPP